MDSVRPALGRAKELVLRRTAARRTRLHWDRPVCSFTFDDVETSAVTNGLPVLSALGIQATWYVAAGLAGRSFAVGDLGLLAGACQDVQCHTYSHYRLRSGSPAGIREDAARNRQALQALLPDRRVEHFSYPFGQVSPAAKAALGHDYQTLRGVFPGVNAGTIDLNLLRGNPIYARRFDSRQVQALIATTVRQRGWLIFYTHGVEAAPDDWGCTAEQLAETAQRCLEAGLEPLSIAQAYEKHVRTGA